MNGKEKLTFIIILLLGLSIRTLNLNWDENQHLHPDERFLTMVGVQIKFPASFSDYLDPSISSLNPYNNNYNFFVYGTFPLNFVKLVAESFKLADYNRFTIVGRAISALLETAVLILVFFVSRELFEKDRQRNKIALWALFFYAISVLPIQLAHFFAVEPFLVFGNTLGLYLLFHLINHPKNNAIISALMGVVIGLALASKVTAIFGIATILLGLIFMLIKERKPLQATSSILIFIIFTYLFLRIGDPRIFSSRNFFDLSLNQQFINNLKELASFNRPESLFPPAIQWIKTKPIIFPLKNLILRGLGLPLGVLAILALIEQSLRIVKKIKKLVQKKSMKLIGTSDINLFLTVTFVTGTFFYQGIQFAKGMRYFYPIYPFLAILTAAFFQRNTSKLIIWRWILGILVLIYPLSFLSIYLHPHSRITASYWIYKNIPADSFLAGEHWDDWLPISFKGNPASIYKGEQLPLYNQENQEKWKEINKILEKTDYLILSSNRLSGSIPKLPEIYPQTSKYYQELFEEKLDFIRVAEFVSYPCFPPVGKPLFCFPDQDADESFTVYDHPKVIIFARKQ
ncbi:MAG TPA: phospholipid carrier-dependent glycosyltransferase [Candidatus Bathyarchaeia archaeon]|nr:phospholipid carrier-dependent glycosyltransferase [Candidatus Bathyarchaeia archaeon]